MLSKKLPNSGHFPHWRQLWFRNLPLKSHSDTHEAARCWARTPETVGRTGGTTNTSVVEDDVMKDDMVEDDMVEDDMVEDDVVEDEEVDKDAISNEDPDDADLVPDAIVEDCLDIICVAAKERAIPRGPCR